jgi:DNA repair protein REV1
MSSYFEASRLHFIGSWKKHLEAVASSILTTSPLFGAPASKSERLIVHIDMDCFFASVAIRDRPELVNLPVAVCHSTSGGGRGGSEISSCNYEARRFGVSAGMWTRRAMELCPTLVTLPYEFDKYTATAEQVYRIFAAFTHHLEAVSCDEAFLEFPSVADPAGLANEIRQRIFNATRCTASAGCAPNMLLARLGTARAKPNGCFVLASSDAEAFMASQPVDALPGVGWVLRRRLRERPFEVKTCGQLAAFSRDFLQQHLGDKIGSSLYDYCRGVDVRDLRYLSRLQRSSIGAEVNWGIRFRELPSVYDFLDQLAAEVCNRSRTSGYAGRTVTLKIMQRAPDAPVDPPKFGGHGACDTFSRSHTLASATVEPAIVGPVVRRLYEAIGTPAHELRGVGISMAKLVRLESLAAERGQSALATIERFVRARPPSPALCPDTSKDGSATDGRGVKSEAGSRATIESVGRVDPPQDLPPLSQLDRAVVQALPRGIRRELAAAYKQQIDTLPAPPGSSSSAPSLSSSSCEPLSATREAPGAGVRGDRALLPAAEDAQQEEEQEQEQEEEEHGQGQEDEEESGGDGEAGNHSEEEPGAFDLGSVMENLPRWVAMTHEAASPAMRESLCNLVLSCVAQAARQRRLDQAAIVLRCLRRQAFGADLPLTAAIDDTLDRARTLLGSEWRGLVQPRRSA